MPTFETGAALGGKFCNTAGPIEQVRYGCSLGALASVIAISGAIPITHCGPGCATKQFHAPPGLNAYQSGEFQVPSTNLGNREVIFGGADRLGARLTGAFLRQVAGFAGLEPRQTEAFIAAEEKEYYLYLRDFAAFYAGCTSQYQLPSHLVVVSESAYNLAVTRFMVDQLGLVPGRQVITENPPQEFRDAIRAQYRDIAGGVSAEVAFAEDGHLIHRLIRETDFIGQLLIVFGSTWEGKLSRELHAPLVEIGYPATDEVVLSRSYIGYRGALALIERTYTTIV